MTINPVITNFYDQYAERGIHLDDFQMEAIQALDSGRDVLVSAPTGSGKTVVAEFAVELALAKSARCVYTAPIKALSNQKYKDLAEKLGEANVGLLTGDQTINREAPIVVVTTEVLRNMLFQRDPSIADFKYAVLDEVHYLADPFRGPVWEEIILQLPEHVRLVSLSATVSNIEEFSGWLRSVRGPTAVVVSTTRPVPLEQYVAIEKKLVPLYDAQGDVSPGLRGLATQGGHGTGYRSQRGVTPVRRRQIAESLEQRSLLPAIDFIFSRKGCDKAVADFLDHNVDFNSRQEARAVRERMAELRAELDDSDARTIKFGFWEKAFARGIGAHHAGMFPALKEMVEELMDRGLLKLVFATGTLALGIDMPVRTVVIEELRRWNGAEFQELSATEYTQLIGRAGRRGKDKVGNSVVVATDDLDIDALADLGSGRLEPLESAFFPSYNTVVNLLRYYEYDEARAIMSTSFAQYQHNADLGQIQGRMSRIRSRIHTLESELSDRCSRGNLVEYLRLREKAGRASKAQRRRAKAEYEERIAHSWDNARTGHLYAYARGGELEYGVALSVSPAKIRFTNIFAEMVWLYRDELSSEIRDLGEIEMPFGLSPKDPQVRESIADSIIAAVDDRTELGVDRDLMGSWDRFAVRANPELEAHPVHTCPDLDEHVADGTELMSLDARLHELDVMAGDFEESVAKEFDATARVLRRLGYLQGDSADVGSVVLGPGADLLRGIHSEADLLISLCLNEAVFAELSPQDFAGICSAFLCDRRLGTSVPSNPRTREAWNAVTRNVDYLVELESTEGISRTGEPFPGGIDAFSAWARGEDLETVLRMSHLVVGDFISANRRLIDLLGQLVEVGSGFWLAETAAAARESIRHWNWL